MSHAHVPKYKIGDYVKCICDESCTIKGAITNTEIDGDGIFAYWVVRQWIRENFLALDQSTINENKMKELLGVKT